MIKNLKFSKEPIIWIGAAIVTLQVVQSFMTGEGFNITLADSFLAAMGALIGRKFVLPVENTPKHAKPKDKSTNA